MEEASFFFAYPNSEVILMFKRILKKAFVGALIAELARPLYNWANK